MFGLSFEKIVIAGIIAVIIIGPSRLPHYAAKLGEIVRLLRAQLDTARTNAAEAAGVESWQSLDPRQYDPRRIIREALDEPRVTEADAAAEAPMRTIITGSSGHPRRRLVAHTTEGHLGDGGGTTAGSTDEQSTTDR